MKAIKVVLAHLVLLGALINLDRTTAFLTAALAPIMELLQHIGTH